MNRLRRRGRRASRLGCTSSSTCPRGHDDQAIAASASAAGIAVAALSDHRMLPAGPALILGYGRIAEAAIERGVRELAAIVRRDASAVPERRQ